MPKTAKQSKDSSRPLPKCPTGIIGLDEITLGGLPRGRPTLVCGGAGCGKTLFGLEFLVRGIREFKEPGVCITFEESPQALAENVRSLGFDLPALVRAKKLVIDHIELDRSRISETGEYDLEGLFIRVGAAIDEVGAQRILIDTPEALFSTLADQAVLRSELQRLCNWLRVRGVTAVITGERGEGTLTRHGLEEYVSDCVVLLEHEAKDSIVTRRLRILKYRGSTHGTNEYPFLIDEAGISVLPVTSLGLDHRVSNDRVSSGVPALDDMVGGRGFYRGSTILLTGGAGTGKTSLGAHFVDAACRRGESAVFFTFEESPEQLMRNMMSIGLNLRQWVAKGLLHIDATRPTTWGIEMHLVRMHKLLTARKPKAVVLDPISSLLNNAGQGDVNTLVLRIVDYLKASRATALFTALTSLELESTELAISSLVDTWLQLRNVEVHGERNRVLYVLKSRGMSHSNQVREFLLTDRGIDLQDVYLGFGGVLTGSARIAQEAKDREDSLRLRQESDFRQAQLEARLRAMDAEIEKLKSEREAHEREMQLLGVQRNERQDTLAVGREAMARSRSRSAEKERLRKARS